VSWVPEIFPPLPPPPLLPQAATPMAKMALSAAIKNQRTRKIPPC
jgi:hypothetical protein